MGAHPGEGLADHGHRERVDLVEPAAELLGHHGAYQPAGRERLPHHGVDVVGLVRDRGPVGQPGREPPGLFLQVPVAGREFEGTGVLRVHRITRSARLAYLCEP